MDSNRVFFPKGVVGFNLHFSGGCGILSVTMSEVGGGRLLSKLKSAMVGAFYCMYCMPTT